MPLKFLPDPNEIVMINPGHVLYFSKVFANSGIHGSRKGSDGSRVFGAIVPDRYIKRGKEFNECPHVRALQERYVDNKEWEDTGYKSLFEDWYLKKRRDSENVSWSSFKEKKLYFWDFVFEDIEKNGYKASSKPQDNVEIVVSGNKEILIADGRHRLFFAALLKIESIPAIVNIWAESLANSYSAASNSKDLCIYHSIGTVQLD